MQFCLQLFSEAPSSFPIDFKPLQIFCNLIVNNGKLVFFQFTNHKKGHIIKPYQLRNFCIHLTNRPANDT